MRITYNEEKKLLDVTFIYSPRLVDAVRTIPGREWKKDRKCWTVPLDNIEEAIKVLLPFGLTVDPKLRDVILEKREIKDVLERVKKGEITYSGDLPLFDFQRTGAAFINHAPASLLADEMGTGKTVQTIAALKDEKKVLVFCPSSLKYNWYDEIKKWTKDSAIVVDGDKETRMKQWTQNIKWYIANYELLLRDLKHMVAITTNNWDAVVCDEATRINNTQTKTYKCLKMINSKKRIALTGTPVSNSPMDVFGIVNWLYPNLLGSWYHFRERYCIVDKQWKTIIGYNHLPELARKLKPIMLRRTKDQVLKDFPPKTYQSIRFDLNPREIGVYEDIKNAIVDKLKKDIDKYTLSTVLVQMLRLKQVTNSLELVTNDLTDSSKLHNTKEILDMIVHTGNSKAILFTQFKSMIPILLRELKEFNPLTIHGDVPTFDRQKIVNQFTESGKNKLIIMTEAGAYGLNLQVASYVIHFDLPWSLAKLRQREDRAHRIGQKNNVTIYNMIARDTIDEYVFKKLYSKQSMSNEILSDKKSRMTKEDLQQILF